MDEPKNRRTDQQGPKTPLRWGERWTLLLTSPTSGIVGQYGATWPGQPAHYERVNVYAEGAAKLDDIEQYRLQMAAIGTASFGYWKEGDSIHPDYDTVPLRDVARLFAKYDQLYKFREQVRVMVAMLKNREWAEDLAATGDAAELQSAITKLLPNQTMHPDDAAVLRWADAMADKMARSRAKGRSGWHDTNRCTAEQLNAMLADHLGKGDPLDVAILAMMLWSRSERTTPAQQAAPDAVDAALADAIQHGTGAFQVKADGSTEHVELSKEDQRHYAELAAFPPKLQRDALYQDYAVPKQDSDPA